jgi:hypothetical protein
MVVEMNVLLDGAEGSWHGTGRAIEQGAGTDPDRRHSTYVLEGEGAYEGMHALLRGVPGHDANGPWDEQYEGWIIEGPVPPPAGDPSAVTVAPTADVAVMAGGEATWVTFIDESCSVQETVPKDDRAIQRMRGARAVCDVQFNDPRVSGRATTDVNDACQAEAGCVTWGEQEIIGPEGGWRGSFEGLIDPAFTERTVAVLNGTGNYSGLTFVVTGVAPLGKAPSVVGLVYEGVAPPMP